MRARYAVAVLSLGLTSCVLRAPSGQVPLPRAAGQDVYGGWALVRLMEPDLLLEGELLAAVRDTVWVLRDDGVHIVHRAEVRRAEVVGFDSRPHDVGRGTALGILATVTHGVFLVATAPLWITTGVLGSIHQESISRVRAEADDLAVLAKFARFPQGPPPGLDLQSLRPRPPELGGAPPGATPRGRRVRVRRPGG
jgi:hypothetical protein